MVVGWVIVGVAVSLALVAGATVTGLAFGDGPWVSGDAWLGARAVQSFC